MILASASAIRLDLLRSAGLQARAVPARIDEDAIKRAARADGFSPRDLADLLAEQKARKIALRHPTELVLGCDQILEFEGEVLSKATDAAGLRATLERLRGKTHLLHSAAVLYQAGRPIWREVGTVRLTMRHLSDAYIQDYISRNLEDCLSAVGGYMLEKEGVRLFSRIDGDHFHVLGLPLIELLNFLMDRGTLPG